MERTWPPLVVTALEFGTTNSGYAFLWRGDFERDPLNIYMHEWHYQTSQSLKTPTCLLLDKKKHVVAFGYDAQNRYAELVMDEEQDEYYFFDRFTTSLHNNENVTRDTVLKDKTGKQCSAVEVFTLSIKALVDRFMKITNETGPYLRDDDIIWVLTVPAAWTDSGKQLMRENAERAGINPEKLLLVNEPEAAFTYCHYLPTTRLQESKPGHMIKEPGTKSMVVDLGDMTADITVIQSTYNGKLKELFSATGDDCGGASVDDRFCKMLEEIFGGNMITKVKRQDPEGWSELLKHFRWKIESVTTSNTKAIIMKCPCSLSEIYNKLHGNDLESVNDSSSYLNEIKGNKFRFKADLMIKLLTPTIDSIITLMKNTVSNRSTNGVSNILMVGSLSEWPMMQDAVYKAFPDNQIIIPDEPGFSVLKGAVLFGHRPDYNRSELCDEGCIGK